MDLYTDGACSRTRGGAGGWGAVLVYRDRQRELSGSEPSTTHNRMELRAVIEGLRALEERARVSVYCDSTYVVKAFTENRLAEWEHRGWKTTKRTPVLNRDLWEELLTEVGRRDVSWSWIKGHNGNVYNERADALATAACAAPARPGPPRTTPALTRTIKSSTKFAALVASYDDSRAALAQFLLDHPTTNDKAWTTEPRLKGETRQAFIERLLG